MIGDETSSAPEWLMIRELLRGRSDVELAKARATLTGIFDSPVSEMARRDRVAFVGLRGAGKSGLGRMLADYWMVPFVELSRYIEKIAGCSVTEIHALYGPNAYRRYEYRAIEEIVQQYRRAVIATPGGIVSEPATFNFLLAHCYTVWLKAAPKDHMERVLAQGDTRPIAGNRQAMQDLNSILESRAAFYSKADQTFDTSELTHEMAFHGLIDRLRIIPSSR
jgi:XRE family aerobic/anaerobic benzoate catabolism transcriptional regulator